MNITRLSEQSACCLHKLSQVISLRGDPTPLYNKVQFTRSEELSGLN